MPQRHHHHLQVRFATISLESRTCLLTIFIFLLQRMRRAARPLLRVEPGRVPLRKRRFRRLLRAFLPHPERAGRLFGSMPRQR